MISLMFNVILVFLLHTAYVMFKCKENTALITILLPVSVETGVPEHIQVAFNFSYLN